MSSSESSNTPNSSSNNGCDGCPGCKPTFRFTDNTDPANPKIHEFDNRGDMMLAYENLVKTRNPKDIVIESSGSSIESFMDIFGSLLKKTTEPKRRAFWLVISENSYGGNAKKLFLNEEDAKKYKIEMVATTGAKADIIIEKIELFESYNLNEQAIIDALVKNHSK